MKISYLITAAALLLTFSLSAKTFDLLSIDSATGDNNKDCVINLANKIIDQEMPQLELAENMVASDKLSLIRNQFSKRRDVTYTLAALNHDTEEGNYGHITVTFGETVDGELSCGLYSHRKGILSGYKRIEAFYLRDMDFNTILESRTEM